MLCVPTPRLLVLQAAVRVLPLPTSATALQPLMVVPSAVKLTPPVGALPVTVAVNVTATPATAGLAELAKVVLLDVVPPGAVTWTVRALAVAERTMILMP